MIWAALTAKVRGWVIGAGAVLGALLLAYFKGRTDTKQERELKDAQEYKDTRKRMDEAGPADSLGFLHERQSKRDL
jgi:hypothetical protein